jgi:hypothetical protein
MTYDPQRNAPRPTRSTFTESSGGSSAPVDALLDGPEDGLDGPEDGLGDDAMASEVRPSGAPPFSVVPEPTAPDADTPKVVAFGVAISFVGLLVAYRFWRWWLGRDSAALELDA